MSTFLSLALLRGPAQRSVRVVAQARLQRVLEEAARVEVRIGTEPPNGPAAETSVGTSDPEAIHDFRVALRRLRAWLRAFRPFLKDTVRHGPESRLRDVSRLAGRARDLDVQYDWLVGPRPGRTGPARTAARWLATKVARERTRARRELVEGIVRDLPGAGSQLAEGLRHYHRDVELGVPSSVSMAAAMAEVLGRASDTLAADLRRVKYLKQVKEAHAARLAVKRLRYLLEQFPQSSRSVARILRQFTILQGLYGDLHDAQVLQARFLKAWAPRKRDGSRTRGGTDRPPPQVLDALGALLARRISTAFPPVRRVSRSPATHRAFTELAALVQRLDRTDGSRGRP